MLFFLLVGSYPVHSFAAARRSSQLMNRNPAIMSVAPRRSQITLAQIPVAVIRVRLRRRYVDIAGKLALNHRNQKKGSSHSRGPCYNKYACTGVDSQELPSPAIILPLRPRFCALQRGTQLYTVLIEFIRCKMGRVGRRDEDCN